MYGDVRTGCSDQYLYSGLPPAKTGLSRNCAIYDGGHFLPRCGITVENQKAVFPDRYQSVLGRGRDTAADAGIVGSGGTGHYSARPCRHLNAMVATGIVAGAAGCPLYHRNRAPLHAGRQILTGA